MAKNNIGEFSRDCDRYIEGVSGQLVFNISNLSGVEKAKDIPGITVNQKRIKRGIRTEVAFKDGRTYKEQQGVVDMKPWFKKSKKVKRTKTGGWYMVVPIRKYTPSAKKVITSPSKGMRRDVYDAVRKLKPVHAETDYIITTSHNNLYKNYPLITSPILELNYERKSTRISKVKKGKQAQYYTFRTVSDKSSPSSWLLNKDKEDVNNPSKEAQRIIKEVHAQIIENMLRL